MLTIPDDKAELAQPVENVFQVVALYPEIFEMLHHALAVSGDLLFQLETGFVVAGQGCDFFHHLPAFFFLRAKFMDQFQDPGLLGGQVHGRIIFTEIIQGVLR